jgi:biopolymer transport protein ExbB
MSALTRIALLILFVCAPAVASAWWHEDWAYRKQLTLDTTPAGANVAGNLTGVPVLVRLHTGNFSYFLDVKPDAADLRFVAADDATPLKFHVEMFDPINEMAMIWVQVPQLAGNGMSESIWMYYGNPEAVDAQDAAGTWDVNQTAVLHFDGQGSAQQDRSAYGNHPTLFTAEVESGGLIANAARFNGTTAIQFPAVPTLALMPDSGWTFSTWMKIDADQGDAVLMQRSSEKGTLTLGIDGQAAFLRLQGIDGRPLETAHNAMISPGSWHHLALVVTAKRLSLFLDAKEVAYLETAVQELNGPLQVGMSLDDGQGFIGWLDELKVANTARSADWLQTMVRGQGPQSALLVYGEDGQQEASHESYIATTLRNVTVDGWVVIVMLAIMSAISWVVMFSKAIVIKRVESDNREFLNQFGRLGAGHEEELDADEGEEDDEQQESPFLLALSGKHKHFESSTLYRIYHAGIQEMHHREARSVGAAASWRLTPQALNVIKATMDGTLVRENQKLNSQMVLLTIAISGGPFLGLLGTVVGVMITFAAIAASGDVNVNAIAPGIAAALVATVAGLAVAIPALFGYNWLGSKIKEISADMQVFVDEFITKIAEQHGD